MTAAQSGECGRIVVRRLLRIDLACGEQVPGHQASACNHSHTVEEVTARDVALHAEFTIPQFTITWLAVA